ncbi:MAG: cation:proton antiporter subunit C [Kiritimatiellae bacterium]|nr:cation:proton antiporter subunit C [Kiritimatiellia bacterium]
MLDFLLGHYAYWFILALLTIGLYGMIMKRNLVKKLVGMTILQSAIILFWVVIASKWNATVPVIVPEIPCSQAANYINPLPHTLMLTAIVVGVATLGVALALLIIIYRNYKTLEENVLIDRMK